MLVCIADFAKDFPSLHRVRQTVFIDEQHVPAELEFDDRDPVCLHLLAIADGAPIGTGRLDVEHGKIGRVAVLAAHRRKGVATQLMARLHELARAQGLSQVWCNAQISARPFYERLGYRSSGDVFDEAGIPHIKMDRPL
jgi:predicted GNAT family N-acyltransferase